MADSPHLVMGVAGRIGSGKSAVAQHLRDRLGFQYLRYSLVLAEWYNEDPAAKSKLQEVGWRVMSGDGQRELNRRVIARIEADRDCVIDGLRHPTDDDSLRTAFAARYFLIYVDTPPDVRFERLRGRYPTYQDFVAADSHPVEANIDKLIPRAGAVIRGAAPIDQLTSDAEKTVERFRSGGNL